MQEKELFASVYILDAVYKIDREYEYSVPAQLASKIRVGALAVVPFGTGNKPRKAIVTKLSDECAYKSPKPVSDIPDTDFFLKQDLLEICLFMKKECFCTFGEAVRTVMPSGITVKVGEYYDLAPGVAITDETYTRLNQAALGILHYIAQGSKVTLGELCENFGNGAKTAVTSLTKLGYIKKNSDVSCHTNQKTSKFVEILCQPDDESFSEKLTEKQQHALEVLASLGGFCSLEELCEICEVGESVIKGLCKKGMAHFVSVKDYRSPYKIEDIPPTEDFTLSQSQQNALDILTQLYGADEAKAALLYGITGSGKTNVILKLIDKVISDGKQVIYLVPEIALTSQTIAIFAGRYRQRVAVVHSALSAGEKLDAWQKINSGDADIVIGTRSAIFAPTSNLGLVVIDEEQESSFKSDMSPKYHARDIARMRCAKTGSLMLLASATPLSESFYKASIGKYTLVTLDRRYGTAKLPEVIIYDMKNENAYENTGDGLGANLIGKELDREIRKNLANGEQTVLFINRRGYHSFVSCRSCGGVFQCPNCSVSLTYHKYGSAYHRGSRLACHYCGYSSELPKICPVCGSEHIGYLGSGTQMLEENLKKAYPSARILRMDTDTTSGKRAHEEILSSFRNGEADILIGTQMVTKGHDFPKVSLVGVILADALLYLNDYRSNEKTFSLITQVLGRAGRAEIPGRAVIQTYSPDNSTLRLSAKQDYTTFYDEEIRLRKAAVFPPFCDIVSFTFSGENESQVKSTAEAFGKRLDALAKLEYRDVKLIVYGPFEATVYKLSGKYRLRYIIKCKNIGRTRQFLSEMYSEFSSLPESVSLSIDVNPSNV